jgi:hypothetical protein
MVSAPIVVNWGRALAAPELEFNHPPADEVIFDARERYEHDRPRVYLGHVDSQVKVRGLDPKRGVEMSSVETHQTRNPQQKQSAPEEP